MGLAEAMAECGGLAARLAVLHDDDGTGHCQGCKWWDRPMPVHPCATRVVAERALEILDEESE